MTSTPSRPICLSACTERMDDGRQATVAGGGKGFRRACTGIRLDAHAAVHACRSLLPQARTCAPTCGGAMVMPSTGRTTRPYLRICSTRPRTAQGTTAGGLGAVCFSSRLVAARVECPTCKCRTSHGPGCPGNTSRLPLIHVIPVSMGSAKPMPLLAPLPVGSAMAVLMPASRKSGMQLQHQPIVNRWTTCAACLAS